MPRINMRMPRIRIMQIIKYLSLIILFLAPSACSNQNNIKSVIINNTEINVEIANTPEIRYKGLSNREELCVNCGMLFIFPEKNKQTFVMRNMNFALDIIWVDDDKIVKINKNALPEGSDPVMRYLSDLPANYVLEVNSGFCEENGIGVGNKINLK